MFYRRRKLPRLILAEMKHTCGRRAILKGNVQPIEREELEPYRLKLPLLHRHRMDVSKHVIPTEIGVERPHSTDGSFTNEMW